MTIYERNPSEYYILALEGGDLVNYIDKLQDPREISIFQAVISAGLLDTHQDVWLGDIYVRGGEDDKESFRHNGLGKKVLKKCEDSFKKKRMIVGLLEAEHGYEEELKEWYLEQGYLLKSIEPYTFVYKELQTH